jgi:predicted metal-dependent TIM-barrel fold hydrolase
VSAQNAIIITEQVGVHPYNINLEISELIKSIEQFNKAISVSEITKLVKGNIGSFLGGLPIKETKNKIKKYFK